MTKVAVLNSATADVFEQFGEDEIGRVALKAFFGIAHAWNLSRDESRVLLGAPSDSTYYRWRQGKVAAIPRDTLERISVLLGIYKALHILLPVARQADTYVRRENADFDGNSALAVMMRGNVDDLYRVRRYLDAWRG
ncbi:MAG: antitoxin Xre-like helix-turn-helix domain-containing protein [Pseudomonadota bacterium]